MSWNFRDVVDYDLNTSLPIYEKSRAITQSGGDEINRVLDKYEINTSNRIKEIMR